MQPRRDQNRPAQRRRGLALAATVGCVGLLGGCSGGASPEDQREEMIAVTTALVEDFAYVTDMSEPEVLDDGSEPVECAGGQRYQYVVYGTTEYDAGNKEMDDRLDSIGTLALGVAPLSSDGDAYFSRADTLELDLNGHGPRGLVVYADSGPAAGVTLTIDYLPGQGNEVLLRFAGTTACG